MSVHAYFAQVLARLKVPNVVPDGPAVVAGRHAKATQQMHIHKYIQRPKSKIQRYKIPKSQNQKSQNPKIPKSQNPKTTKPTHV